jgi:DNA-binding MarR family transcriptional regulator
MVNVAKAHRNLVAAKLANFGLHVGQELLLMHLWEENGLPQSELTERLHVEPPTVTRMLNRLEKSGLLERRRDADDARVCRIYLTSAGWSLQEPVIQCWKQTESQLLNHLTSEEKILFRRLLLQVYSNLTSAQHHF